MDILFVWPTNTSLVSRESHKKIKSRRSLSSESLTFQILAALTPQKHNIKIVEGGANDIDFDKNYDLVGITCTTPYALSAYSIADEFKRRKTTAILGGWHPSALPDEAKQHADSVIIGEAEETWPKLLNDFENNKLKPFYFPERAVDPKIIPNPRNIPSNGVKQHPIQATRGCPYGCGFCAITNMKFRNIFRARPIDKVIEEIKSLPEKVFSFHDNSLTINPNYTKQLFKELKKLGKKFHGFGNIDILGKDEEFLKLASEAGCITWYVGFESISQDSLNSIGKKTNHIEDYKEAIEKIHDYGMMIIGSFIFGFDYDTHEIFNKTDEFVNESGLDIPHYHILMPYPGTPIYEKLEKEGRILTKDWSRYDQKEVVFQPKHMSPEELMNNVKRIHRQRYESSPMIKRILRSLRHGIYPFIETMTENFEVKNYWYKD